MRTINDILASQSLFDDGDIINPSADMPVPFTTTELTERAVANSAIFDRKAYEAHGGDDWIDSRRE